MTRTLPIRRAAAVALAAVALTLAASSAHHRHAVADSIWTGSAPVATQVDTSPAAIQPLDSIWTG